MHFPNKLGLSAFLMLMLIQTALSVPAETNNKLHRVKLHRYDVLSYSNPDEINRKLDNLLEEISNQELDDVIPASVDKMSRANPMESFKEMTKMLKNLVKEGALDVKQKVNDFLKKLKELLEKLSNHKVIENYRQIRDQLKNLVKQESAEVKANVDEFLNHINPIAVKNKLNKLLEKLSNQNLIENYRNLTNLVKEDLAEVKPKAEGVVANINSPETNKKLKDVMAGLSNHGLAENNKKMTERFNNLVKDDLHDVKDKIDELLARIDSSETSNKLEEILEGLSNKELAESIKNSAEHLKNLVKQELIEVRAKIVEFIGHVKPGNKNH